MTSTFPSDEDLVRRLPLPLAHLYRRAHNAKTSLERHQAAYYLWEATLKLLGSVTVVEYLALGDPDPQLAERLRNLARPALGHWWEFVRRLVPVLAKGGDRNFTIIQDLLLGRARDSLPRAAGLDAALAEALDGRRSAQSTVRLSELFDRLVRYRNREVGHGAAGQRSGDFYERMARALLGAASELLTRLDVLAGRRLVYIADVRRQPTGTWLVEPYELIGEAERRTDALEMPYADSAGLPHPQRVYLQAAEEEGRGPASTPPGRLALRSLDPLIIYDAEAGEVLFFSTRRTQQRVEYLCYTTGRVLERKELAGGQEALVRLLDLEAAGDTDRDSTETVVPGLSEATGKAGQPPRQVGEFELLSTLGCGSMGAVFRAWQPSLGRQVALKCLLRSGDPKAEARFAREIRALGRVEHPHLVKVFTSGSEGDQWFYAMELVDGANLAAVWDKLRVRSSSASELDWNSWQETVNSVCREARKAEKLLGDAEALAPRPGDLPPAPPASLPRSQSLASHSFVRHVVELIEQVTEAAHALHEAGIIHRDIKPGNIMVTAGGSQAILMDLGLAQLTDQNEGRLTSTRQFVGTLRYASPEQVLAVGGLDRRSDVYSLGATLWELLALRPLYDAGEQLPTPELMRRIQYQEPKRLRPLHSGITADLEAIVLKCLEKDQDRRYATAQELADDLRRYLAGEPVQARLISTWERGFKWIKRRPGVAALAGVSAVAVAGLVVGSWEFNFVSVGMVAVVSLLVAAWWYNGRLQNALRKLAQEHLVAQRHVERLHLLLEMTRRLMNAPDLDTLLRLISETTTRLANADRATIYLIDREHGELWSKVTLGDDVKTIRVPLGVGIAGTVAVTGEMINIPDCYADRRFNPEIDRRTGYKTRSMLTVPMTAHDGRILGVFQVLNKQTGVFMPEDIEILAMLAASAAVAVETAHLRTNEPEPETPHPEDLGLPACPQ